MKTNLLRFVSCLLSMFFLAGFACPAQEGSSVGQATAPTQTNAPERSNIAVENWVQPQRGWLYVLDPKPEAGGPGGRVRLVDPATGKVMGSIRTGDGADFALSPDGSRLYVASVTEGDSSELAVIDTAQGAVLKSGAVNGRAVTEGLLPPFSTMAVSGDGLALRILIATREAPDKDAFMLATFDTSAGEFLPGIVHLGNCGPGRFISYPAADHFDVLCPRTNRIRLIQVAADSSEIRNVDVVLPWERRDGVGEAIAMPGSQYIAIVRGDGGVVAMDVKTHDFGKTAADSGLPNRIPPAAWPTSPDGSRVYLGHHNDYDRHNDNRFYLDYGRSPNIRPTNATADEFRVFDTSTWKKLGTIRTKMPFWSAVIGNDGRMLYAMAPQKHSILVIDTAKMRQIRVLQIGGMPALALVAP
ncbi:MAG TPA: hypothetical protein VEH47_09060 [Candidatus Acidoferrales bacterium]|nr:hypothetical protein [Candidatus Acidoferrales bacterium]